MRSYRTVKNLALFFYIVPIVVFLFVIKYALAHPDPQLMDIFIVLRSIYWGFMLSPFIGFLMTIAAAVEYDGLKKDQYYKSQLSASDKYSMWFLLLCSTLTILLVVWIVSL